MFFDCCYLALNNPDDILPYRTEKSGLLEFENPEVYYDYPSSKFPLINIPYQLYDFEHNSLPPGFYLVVLAPDRKMMHLVQSNKIKASVPVAHLVEEAVNEEEEREKLKKKEKLEKKYKKRPRKKPLDTSYLEEQADMEASIVDTKENYYILKYKNGRIQATGYILK